MGPACRLTADGTATSNAKDQGKHSVLCCEAAVLAGIEKVSGLGEGGRFSFLFFVLVFLGFTPITK